MSDTSNEMLLGDLEIALPLFLSRPGANLPAALRPPPLPIVYRMRSAGIRVLLSGRGALGLGAVAGAVGLVYLALPAVSRVAQYVDTQYADAKPALVEAPRPMRSRLSQALAMVAELEARLAFGVSFGDHLDAADAIRPVPESAASALAAAMASGSEGVASSDNLQSAGEEEEEEPVALMVLHNLPANAALREGAAAGDGAWAIPVTGMDALTGALGEGFDSPVVVDVEMVSQAGVTLRTMHVTLQKDAVAAVAEAPGEAMLSTGSITSDMPDASAQSQEIQKEKPAKRRHQARRRAISTSDVASDEKRPRRGARNADAWSASTQRDNARAQVARTRAMAVGAQNAEEEANPGLIAKFVGWFSGSSSNAAEPAESASPAAPATPQQTASDTDDSFSRFGMFQSE